MFPIALIIYMLGIVIPKRIIKRRNIQKIDSLEQTQQLAISFWNWKILLFTFIMIIFQTFILRLVTLLPLSIIVKIVYYLILMGIAILFSYWFKPRKYVPILIPTIVLFVMSIFYLILFFNSPVVGFRISPEIIPFALNSYAAKIYMFPLDIAVFWTTWKIASVIIQDRRRRKKER